MAAVNPFGILDLWLLLTAIYILHKVDVPLTMQSIYTYNTFVYLLRSVTIIYLDTALVIYSQHLDNMEQFRGTLLLTPLVS
jgi:hypothetical protein